LKDDIKTDLKSISFFEDMECLEVESSWGRAWMQLVRKYKCDIYIWFTRHIQFLTGRWNSPYTWPCKEKNTGKI